MKAIKIIKSKVWYDKKTGFKCSIYGCRPYKSDNWKLLETGYTTKNDNGTVGNGKKPFKTLDDAIRQYPDLPIES